MGVGLGRVKDPRKLVPAVLGQCNRVQTTLTGGDGPSRKAETWVYQSFYMLSFPVQCSIIGSDETFSYCHA